MNYRSFTIRHALLLVVFLFFAAYYNLRKSIVSHKPQELQDSNHEPVTEGRRQEIESTLNRFRKRIVKPERENDNPKLEKVNDVHKRKNDTHNEENTLQLKHVTDYIDPTVHEKTLPLKHVTDYIDPTVHEKTLPLKHVKDYIDPTVHEKTLQLKHVTDYIDPTVHEKTLQLKHVTDYIDPTVHENTLPLKHVKDYIDPTVHDISKGRDDMDVFDGPLTTDTDKNNPTQLVGVPTKETVKVEPSAVEVDPSSPLEQSSLGVEPSPHSTEVPIGDKSIGHVNYESSHLPAITNAVSIDKIPQDDAVSIDKMPQDDSIGKIPQDDAVSIGKMDDEVKEVPAAGEWHDGGVGTTEK